MEREKALEALKTIVRIDDEGKGHWTAITREDLTATYKDILAYLSRPSYEDCVKAVEASRNAYHEEAQKWGGLKKIEYNIAVAVLDDSLLALRALGERK